VNVLFLALGASRRRAVVEECRQVVADGGTATVVVDSAAPWQRDRLPDGVVLIEAAVLQPARSLMRIEHLVIYRGPRFVLRRVLRRRAKRAVGAYQKRVADRFHRRIFLPVYRRLWGKARGHVVARHIARSERPYDWIIVTDSPSMPDAVRLLAELRGAKPGVAYSIDHVAATAG
jgi:hypothetical protein